MAAITMIIPPSVGRAVIAKEHQSGMVSIKLLASTKGENLEVLRLGCLCQKIKERVIVEQKIGRFAALGSNHVGSLDRVTTEEDWLVGCEHRVTFMLSEHLPNSAQQYHLTISQRWTSNTHFKLWLRP